jgi:hypothetical protein
MAYWRLGRARGASNARFVIQTDGRIGSLDWFSRVQALIGCRSERIWARPMYTISSLVFAPPILCSGRGLLLQD